MCRLVFDCCRQRGSVTAWCVFPASTSQVGEGAGPAWVPAPSWRDVRAAENRSTPLSYGASHSVFLTPPPSLAVHSHARTRCRTSVLPPRPHCTGQLAARLLPAVELDPPPLHGVTSMSLRATGILRGHPRVTVRLSAATPRLDPPSLPPHRIRASLTAVVVYSAAATRPANVIFLPDVAKGVGIFIVPDGLRDVAIRCRIRHS